MKTVVLLLFYGIFLLTWQILAKPVSANCSVYSFIGNCSGTYDAACSCGGDACASGTACDAGGTYTYTSCWNCTGGDGLTPAQEARACAGCGGGPAPACTGTCSGPTVCSACGVYSSSTCSECNGRSGGVTADFECCTQANRVAADSCGQGCTWDSGTYTGNNCSGAARWCQDVITCSSKTDQTSCQGTTGCTWTPLDPYACSTSCSAPCGGGTCNNACGQQISCNLQPCCTAVAPAAPSLSSPANGAQSQNLQTTISWAAPSNWGTGCPSNNNAYKVYFDNHSSATTLVYSGTNTSYQAANLSFATTYYWRVVANNGSLDSPSSPEWSFTTRPQAYFQTAGGGVVIKGSITNTYLPAGKYISGR